MKGIEPVVALLAQELRETRYLFAQESRCQWLRGQCPWRREASLNRIRRMEDKIRKRIDDNFHRRAAILDGAMAALGVPAKNYNVRLLIEDAAWEVDSEMTPDQFWAEYRGRAGLALW